MQIVVTLDSGTSFTAELYTNSVAQELADRLPITLTFNDFNGVEKVARMSAPLPVSGVPAQDAPSPGEIGYYAPSQGLVFYYGHVGRWPGLVRIGRFDFDPGDLRALPDGTTAQLVPANTTGG